MELKDLQNLIRFVSKSEVAEVKYKTNDFEIVIKNLPSTPPQVVTTPNIPIIPSVVPSITPATTPPASTPAAQEIKTSEEEDTSKYITIKSPMIGTFYRKPGPDKEPFVNVGDMVTPGKVVCIIEAMKLFNEIESEVSGKIVKVLVDDASPVEYDQPLFLVDPS